MVEHHYYESKSFERDVQQYINWFERVEVGADESMRKRPCTERRKKPERHEKTLAVVTAARRGGVGGREGEVCAADISVGVAPDAGSGHREALARSGRATWISSLAHFRLPSDRRHTTASCLVLPSHCSFCVFLSFFWFRVLTLVYRTPCSAGGGALATLIGLWDRRTSNTAGIMPSYL